MIEDLQVFEVIQSDTNREQEIAKLIVHCFSNNSVFVKYRGTIPLLDAYHFFGKASVDQLISPGMCYAID